MDEMQWQTQDRAACGTSDALIHGWSATELQQDTSGNEQWRTERTGSYQPSSCAFSPTYESYDQHLTAGSGHSSSGDLLTRPTLQPTGAAPRDLTCLAAPALCGGASPVEEAGLVTPPDQQYLTGELVSATLHQVGQVGQVGQYVHRRHIDSQQQQQSHSRMDPIRRSTMPDGVDLHLASRFQKASWPPASFQSGANWTDLDALESLQLFQQQAQMAQQPQPPPPVPTLGSSGATSRNVLWPSQSADVAGSPFAHTLTETSRRHSLYGQSVSVPPARSSHNGFPPQLESVRFAGSMVPHGNTSHDGVATAQGASLPSGTAGLPSGNGGLHHLLHLDAVFQDTLAAGRHQHPRPALPAGMTAPAFGMTGGTASHSHVADGTSSSPHLTAGGTPSLLTQPALLHDSLMLVEPVEMVLAWVPRQQAGSGAAHLLGAHEPLSGATPSQQQLLLQQLQQQQHAQSQPVPGSFPIQAPSVSALATCPNQARRRGFGSVAWPDDAGTVLQQQQQQQQQQHQQQQEQRQHDVQHAHSMPLDFYSTNLFARMPLAPTVSHQRPGFGSPAHSLPVVPLTDEGQSLIGYPVGDMPPEQAINKAQRHSLDSGRAAQLRQQQQQQQQVLQHFAGRQQPLFGYTPGELAPLPESPLVGQTYRHSFDGRTAAMSAGPAIATLQQRSESQPLAGPRGLMWPQQHGRSHLLPHHPASQLQQQFSSSNQSTSADDVAAAALRFAEVGGSLLRHPQHLGAEGQCSQDRRTGPQDPRMLCRRSASQPQADSSAALLQYSRSVSQGAREQSQGEAIEQQLQQQQQQQQRFAGDLIGGHQLSHEGKHQQYYDRAGSSDSVWGVRDELQQQLDDLIDVQPVQPMLKWSGMQLSAFGSVTPVGDGSGFTLPERISGGNGDTGVAPMQSTSNDQLLLHLDSMSDAAAAYARAPAARSMSSGGGPVLQDVHFDVTDGGGGNVDATQHVDATAAAGSVAGPYLRWPSSGGLLHHHGGSSATGVNAQNIHFSAEMLQHFPFAGSPRFRSPSAGGTGLAHNPFSDQFQSPPTTAAPAATFSLGPLSAPGPSTWQQRWASGSGLLAQNIFAGQAVSVGSRSLPDPLAKQQQQQQQQQQLLVQQQQQQQHLWPDIGNTTLDDSPSEGHLRYGAPHGTGSGDNVLQRYQSQEERLFLHHAREGQQSPSDFGGRTSSGTLSGTPSATPSGTFPSPFLSHSDGKLQTSHSLARLAGGTPPEGRAVGGAASVFARPQSYSADRSQGPPLSDASLRQTMMSNRLKRSSTSPLKSVVKRMSTSGSECDSLNSGNMDRLTPPGSIDGETREAVDERARLVVVAHHRLHRASPGVSHLGMSDSVKFASGGLDQLTLLSGMPEVPIKIQPVLPARNLGHDTSAVLTERSKGASLDVKVPTAVLEADFAAAAGEDKHAAHWQMERKRREQMNSLFDELDEIVPSPSAVSCKRGPSKARPKHILLSDAAALIRQYLVTCQQVPAQTLAQFIPADMLPSPAVVRDLSAPPAAPTASFAGPAAATGGTPARAVATGGTPPRDVPSLGSTPATQDAHVATRTPDIGVPSQAGVPEAADLFDASIDLFPPELFVSDMLDLDVLNVEMLKGGTGLEEDLFAAPGGFGDGGGVGGAGSTQVGAEALQEAFQQMGKPSDKIRVAVGQGSVEAGAVVRVYCHHHQLAQVIKALRILPCEAD